MWRQMTMFVLIFLTFDHVSGKQENAGWVEIGMKGRKYIVFWDGIGLKLIIVSKTFIYLLYISLIV